MKRFIIIILILGFLGCPVASFADDPYADDQNPTGLDAPSGAIDENDFILIADPTHTKKVVKSPIVDVMATSNAATATLAATVTIADNESTDETNAVVFLPGGDLDGGNLALESDGTFYYNPSTGKVNATIFESSTIYLLEQAEASADVATYGQIWVNTATPNELWFTDDAGTDFQLGIAGSDDQTLAEVLASGADANDLDITSMDKLEGFDAAVYIDMGADTFIDLAADGYVILNTPYLEIADGVVFLKEQAEADGDRAGYGQLWVNTATPNELYFTDDAGTDFQLGTGGDFKADGTVPMTATLGLGAAAAIDATGAVDIDIGSADITDISFYSDGDFAFVPPADTDIVLNFTGTTAQGSVTYMEDEDRFDFDNDVDVIGDLTAGTIVSDGDFTVGSGGDPADTGTALNMVNGATMCWEDGTEDCITHVNDTGFSINRGLTVTGVLTMTSPPVLLGATFPSDPGADRYLLWDDSETGSELTWGEISGGGDLLANGTVPLTAAWDAGSYKITASDLEADTGDVTVGDDILLADGAVVGITGNEVMTFNAAGSINFTGASVDVDGAFTASTVASDGAVSGTTITGTGKLSTVVTTEQFRLGYDATNYLTATLADDGHTTIATVDPDGAEADINLNPDGNVGIKTADPSVELEVTGDIKASGSISGQAEVLTDTSGAITITVNAVNYGTDTGDADIPDGACDAAGDVGNWVVLISSAADAYSLTSDDASNQFTITDNASALTAGDELDVDGTMVSVMCIAAELWKVTGYMGAIPTDGGEAD